MTPIFSVICLTASIASRTAWDPSFASVEALRAIRSVSDALSAFCLIVEVISSTEAEISSVEAACSDAPEATSPAVLESSFAPRPIFSLAPLMPPIISPRSPRMVSSARRRVPVSSFAAVMRSSKAFERSPEATISLCSEA